MKPLRFRWIERKPVHKEGFFALILSRSNQFLDITPFLWSESRYLNVEATVFIIPHYGKLLELTLNFDQTFQHIAANGDFTMTHFTHCFYMRSV